MWETQPLGLNLFLLHIVSLKSSSFKWHHDLYIWHHNLYSQCHYLWCHNSQYSTVYTPTFSMYFPIGTMIYPVGTTIYCTCTTIDSLCAHILMVFYSTSLGPPPLALMAYTKAEILEKISRLKDNQQYTEVLTLGRQPIDEEVQAARAQNKTAGNELKTLTMVPNDHTEGTAPAEHNCYLGVDTACNQLYGLADMRDHTQLM